MSYWSWQRVACPVCKQPVGEKCRTLLDALPEDSVVSDDSRYVYEKATARRWYQPGWEGQRWSDAIDLPATVLWSPGGER